MLEGQRFEPDGRLAQFMRMVDAFERNEVEEAVDRLIDMLDQCDGDADREDDEGGEIVTDVGADYDPAIDAIVVDGMPGDAIDGEDSECGQHAVDHSGRMLECPSLASLLAHDDEDGEYAGDEYDTGNAEDEVMTGDLAGDGPGCPLSDPGEYAHPENDGYQGYYMDQSGRGEDDEPSNGSLIALQRLRIQATRCTSYIYRGRRRFELRPPISTPPFGRRA